jgi:hypothetical protein
MSLANSTRDRRSLLLEPDAFPRGIGWLHEVADSLEDGAWAVQNSCGHDGAMLSKGVRRVAATTSGL